MPNFDAYSGIAKNYADSSTRKISKQIVIDHENNPKVVGVWGRLVRFFSSLRKGPERRNRIYQTAIANFQTALEKKFANDADALVAANKSLQNVTNANRSLRARDVHDAILAANKSNEAKVQAEADDAAIKQQLKKDAAMKRQDFSEEMKRILGQELTDKCRKILNVLDNPIRTTGDDLTADENVALLLCTGRVGNENIMFQINSSLDTEHADHDKYKIVRANIDSAIEKIQKEGKKDFYLVAQHKDTFLNLTKDDIIVKDYTVLEYYEYNDDKNLQKADENSENRIPLMIMRKHSPCRIEQEDGSFKHFLIRKPGFVYSYQSTTKRPSSEAKCYHYKEY